MPLSKPIIPVILSGGSGTRLWPMSKPERPKQMLALTAEDTMLQLTARRACGERFAAPIVVANARHADMVEEQLERGRGGGAGADPRADGAQHRAGDRAGRAGGGRRIGSAAGDAVGPCHHRCAGASMRRSMQRCRWWPKGGWSRSASIRRRPRPAMAGSRSARRFRAASTASAKFVEKPPRDKAEAMLAAGDHAWNGGIFLFRADIYLGALARSMRPRCCTPASGRWRTRAPRGAASIRTPMPLPPRRPIRSTMR